MQLKELARGLSMVTLAASLAAAGPARAQEEPAPAPAVSTPAPAPAGTAAAFGAPGAWVFSSQTADSGSGFFFFHKTSGGNSTFQLNPAVDYFLAPNISLGASLDYTYNSGPGGGSSFGAGVRAGYNLNLNSAPAIGFWPMARFFVMHSSQSTDTALSIFAPFLWHLVPHFFMGAGPSVDIGLSGLTSTQYGIDFILGGWL
jgi:hypothetical protein